MQPIMGKPILGFGLSAGRVGGCHVTTDARKATGKASRSPSFDDFKPPPAPDPREGGRGNGEGAVASIPAPGASFDVVQNGLGGGDVQRGRRPPRRRMRRRACPETRAPGEVVDRGDRGVGHVHARRQEGSYHSGHAGTVCAPHEAWTPHRPRARFARVAAQLAATPVDAAAAAESASRLTIASECRERARLGVTRVAGAPADVLAYVAATGSERRP